MNEYQLLSSIMGALECEGEDSYTVPSIKQVEEWRRQYALLIPHPVDGLKDLGAEMSKGMEYTLREVCDSPAITAAMVSKLRGETDAPMMSCKAALTACKGDHEKALEYLALRGNR
jgi:hypothetical protein